MVKDHSDSEKGNPLPPHRLLLSISSKGSHRQNNTYHGLCYTSRGALAGTRNSSRRYSESQFKILILGADLKRQTANPPSSLAGPGH